MDRSAPGSPRDTALAFLLSRIDYERTLAMPYGNRNFMLDRMRELLVRLGRPQDRLPAVHVAGTKGKGSVSAMTAAVLSAAGYRTGLYSSPHLDRLEERLVVDGQACSAAELVDLVDRLRPIVANMDAEAGVAGNSCTGPTYFELTTAMALLYFAERGAQIAVLEVGLGGRLDSTNVCRPAVSAITSISFDHMKQLGCTLGAIAREKAGIIKPGVPVVSGVTESEPRRVIADICRQRGSPLLELGHDFNFDYQAPQGLQCGPAPSHIDYHLDGRDRHRVFTHLAIGLVGRHQGANAAVAVTALDELARQGWQVSDEAVRHGLASVCWPARIEVVARQPAVVIDAAHNVASIRALLTTLDESFAAPRRLLVFATSRDKEIAAMLALLLPRFDRLIFTRYLNNPRGVPAEELAEIAGRLGSAGADTWTVRPDPASAWNEIASLVRDDDLVCVTGSFFIAAEMRAQFESRPLHPRSLAFQPEPLPITAEPALARCLCYEKSPPALDEPAGVSCWPRPAV